MYACSVQSRSVLGEVDGAAGLISFIRSKIAAGAMWSLVAISLLQCSYAGADGVNTHSYPELGITTSLYIVHPSFGYWFGKTGIRFTGMYLTEDKYEFHLNFGYALYDTDKTQHTINLLSSCVSASDPGADYRYTATGLAYGINYRGFFLELGLAYPLRDDIGNLDDPVIPCGYMGYIHRFRTDRY